MTLNEEISRDRRVLRLVTSVERAHRQRWWQRRRLVAADQDRRIAQLGDPLRRPAA